MIKSDDTIYSPLTIISGHLLTSLICTTDICLFQWVVTVKKRGYWRKYPKKILLPMPCSSSAQNRDDISKDVPLGKVDWTLQWELKPESLFFSHLILSREFKTWTLKIEITYWNKSYLNCAKLELMALFIDFINRRSSILSSKKQSPSKVWFVCPYVFRLGQRRLLL